MSDHKFKCPATLPTGSFKDQVIDKMNVREEGFVILRPGEEWIPEEWIPGKKQNKCTCGMAAIGGGLHSDYCDLYEEPHDE